MDALTFSQMLCSRLCHDLITPIGAVSSGFEILEACDDAERENLIDLTRRSAETASRRLTFYRAAFGYSLASQYSSLTSIKQLMESFLRSVKIHFEWPSVDTMDQNKELDKDLASWGRLFMNIVLSGAEGMPYGGEIQIIDDDSDSQNLDFKICFKGDLVTIRPDVMMAFKGQLQPHAYTPYTIQAVLVRMLAEQLRVDLLPDQISNQEFQLQAIGSLS